MYVHSRLWESIYLTINTYTSTGKLRVDLQATWSKVGQNERHNHRLFIYSIFLFNLFLLILLYYSFQYWRFHLWGWLLQCASVRPTWEGCRHLSIAFVLILYLAIASYCPLRCTSFLIRRRVHKTKQHWLRFDDLTFRQCPHLTMKMTLYLVS